jgi:hypothetical protein
MLDTQAGLRIPAAIPSSHVLLYKTIDANISCLYPQPRHVFPPALRKAAKQRNLRHNQNPP